MEIRYLKSAARLLKREYDNRGGLHLYKESLWVSVGQRAAELPAVKVRGKKIYRSARFEPALFAPGRSAEFFFKPPFFMIGISAAL